MKLCTDSNKSLGTKHLLWSCEEPSMFKNTLVSSLLIGRMLINAKLPMSVCDAWCPMYSSVFIVYLTLLTI